MKRTIIMQSLRQVFFLCLSGLFVWGCTETPVSPTTGGADITFRTAIDNSRGKSSSQTGSHGSIPSAGSAVDSIEITSAGFFVSNMIFFGSTTGDETDPNRTEIGLRADHFILDFESWGKQYIGDKTLPAVTFRSIRFTMLPAGASSDSLANALGPVFNTFFRSAPGSTVVMRGNIWSNGQMATFEYRSQISGNELAIFDGAYNVSADNPFNEVDVQLSTGTAFGNGSGVLMDPRDSRNAAAIDANLKLALKASQTANGS
ncbi:MAG: hypothetical protein ACHQM6_07490 [Candidatus Kapaibacterium sp.]